MSDAKIELIGDIKEQEDGSGLITIEVNKEGLQLLVNHALNDILLTAVKKELKTIPWYKRLWYKLGNIK